MINNIFGDKILSNNSPIEHTTLEGMIETGKRIVCYSSNGMLAEKFQQARISDSIFRHNNSEEISPYRDFG